MRKVKLAILKIRGWMSEFFDWFRGREFDKESAKAALCIFSGVLGGAGALFLAVWLIARHPQVVIGIVIALALLLMFVVLFDGIFPKKTVSKCHEDLSEDTVP